MVVDWEIQIVDPATMAQLEAKELISKMMEDIVAIVEANELVKEETEDIDKTE